MIVTLSGFEEVLKTAQPTLAYIDVSHPMTAVALALLTKYRLAQRCQVIGYSDKLTHIPAEGGNLYSGATSDAFLAIESYLSKKESCCLFVTNGVGEITREQFAAMEKAGKEIDILLIENYPDALVERAVEYSGNFCVRFVFQLSVAAIL